MNRLVALDEVAPPWDEAPLPDAPPGLRSGATPQRPFNLERWCDITFEATEEWLIKRFLPRRGVAAIYGKPGAFKSFVALFIALCVALGRDFAGRRTSMGSVVYIGAEGAAGLRKRKAGYVKAWADLRADVDFALIPGAPNLGAAPGDFLALVAAIEAAGILPTLIVVDTVAKTIGAGDENGAGMAAFVGNAGALAEHFGCLVLAVHHVGLGDEAQKRMRGHSSLHGALDAQIFCERREGENVATLTLQKLKDDASDVKLTAQLSRVVVGFDEDGEEASTLIVDDVTAADTPATQPQRSTIVPPSRRLLRDVIIQAIDDEGEDVRPFGATGPTVRAVDAERVRERYYAAIAEQADDDEDEDKLAERQRKAFSRALKAMLDAKDAHAREVDGRRMIWLP
jgi:hypothetical protein